MSDYISRQAAIDTLEQSKDKTAKGEVGGFYNAIIQNNINRLIRLPSADVVEVVRCKDCRFHEDEQAGMVYCPEIVGGWVEDDWFCKGGERRTDDE